MRIFVYEYVCGRVGIDPAVPVSLLSEGRAMRDAVLADLRALPGTVPVTLAPAADEEGPFRRLSADCDFTLVIAPEFDGLLLERCRWAEESGRLLGPSPASVALAADKVLLARALRERGVPTPPAFLWPDPPVVAPADVAETLRFPAVYKPRDGAGSQATILVRSRDDLALAGRTARAEGWHGEMIVQPLVEGLSASISFLCGPDGYVALPAAAQRLSTDGRFRYLGGRLPIPEPLSRRAERLGRVALDAVTGPETRSGPGPCRWRGYVGVDVILTGEDDGSGDAVIEINPRLTTSYVGLRRFAAGNLAGALIDVALGRETGPLRWKPGGVRFDPDGTVEELP